MKLMGKNGDRYFASCEWHIIDEFNKNYLSVVLSKLGRHKEEWKWKMSGLEISFRYFGWIRMDFGALGVLMLF